MLYKSLPWFLFHLHLTTRNSKGSSTLYHSQETNYSNSIHLELQEGWLKFFWARQRAIYQNREGHNFFFRPSTFGSGSTFRHPLEDGCIMKRLYKYEEYFVHVGVGLILQVTTTSGNLCYVKLLISSWVKASFSQFTTPQLTKVWSVVEYSLKTASTRPTDEWFLVGHLANLRLQATLEFPFDRLSSWTMIE